MKEKSTSKKICYRGLSLLITAAMIVSSFLCIGSISVLADELLHDEIYAAAKAYVAENGNNSTQAGLLEAVQEVADVSIVSGKYYIKYAVPGVSDDDVSSGYPLSIPGTDGAVSAIFEDNSDGEWYGVAVPIIHEEEAINISDVAVAGVSAGITYDGSGNITAYSGHANKLVVPSDYSGTVATAGAENALGDIRVVILGNQDLLPSSAFQNQKLIKAIQLADGTGSAYDGHNRRRWWNGDASSAADPGRQFADCSSLKYLHLPEYSMLPADSRRAIPNFCFLRCSQLENINVPIIWGNYSIVASSRAFDGIGARELMFRGYGDKQWPNVMTGNTVTPPARNVNYYAGANKTAMSFARATALAAAAAATCTGTTESSALTQIKNGIQGNDYAATARESYTYEWLDFDTDTYSISGDLLVTNLIGTENEESVVIKFKRNLTLDSLSVSGYALDNEFDVDTSVYNLTVNSNISSVTVNAVPAEGATITSITPSNNLSEGVNAIVITGTTVNSDSFTYTINITRKVSLNAAKLAQIRTAFEDCVKAKGNDITLEDCENAVKAVAATAVLNTADFYVKHAVDGCTDDDTTSGYPLNIPGSDGAVAAIFTIDDTRVGYSFAIPHKDEVIHINKVAIVGTDSGFSFDANGNVNGYSGDADKIVFPTDYRSTMEYVSNPNVSFPNRANVKVVMIKSTGDNIKDLKQDAFNGWLGLRALDLFGQTRWYYVGHNNLLAANRIVAACPNLKYVSLPNGLDNGATVGAQNFVNLPSLENVNIPVHASYGNACFTRTAVRDFIIGDFYNGGKTQWATATVSGESAFTNPYYKTGTGNLKLMTNNESLTFIEAVAYMQAGGNKAYTNMTNSSTVEGYFTSGINCIPDPATYVSGLSVDLSGLTTAGGHSTADVVATKGDDFVTMSYDFTAKAGDLDGNNVLNAGDLTKYVNYLIGRDEEYVEAALDMNNDSQVNLIDLIKIKREIAGVNTYNGPLTYSTNDPLKTYITGEYITAETSLSDANLNNSALTTEDFLTSVGYVNEAGVITDTMFDSFAFSPVNTYIYKYGFAANVGPQHRSCTVDAWRDYIYKYEFRNGYNMDALDEAAGIVKEALNRPDYQISVYLTALYPAKTSVASGFTTNFGYVNGRNLDLTVEADRLAAMKWFADEQIRVFNNRNYKNIRIAGFYWFEEEDMSDSGDTALLQAFNSYVTNDLYMQVIWSPYYNASTYSNWSTYGFTKASMQTNYSTDADIGNGSSNIQRITDTYNKITAASMGMEVELQTLRTGSCTDFKTIMSKGIQLGYMGGYNFYYVCAGPQTVKQLYLSDIANVRSSYDILHKYIKGTLTLSDFS